MLDGMSDSIQRSRIENLHSREVDRQSPTGLIFNVVFSVIVGLYIVIYLHCQALPSMFCRGRYKNSSD